MTLAEIDKLVDNSQDMIERWNKLFSKTGDALEQTNQVMNNMAEKLARVDSDKVRIEVQFMDHVPSAYTFGEIPIDRIANQSISVYPSAMADSIWPKPQISMRDSTNRGIFLKRLSMDTAMDAALHTPELMRRLIDRKCILWDATFMRIGCSPAVSAMTWKELRPFISNATRVDRAKGRDEYKKYTDLERLFLCARNDVLMAKLFEDTEGLNASLIDKFSTIQDDVGGWTILSDGDTGMDMSVYFESPERLHNHLHELVDIVRYITAIGQSSTVNNFNRLYTYPDRRLFDAFTIDSGSVQWFMTPHRVLIQPELVLSVYRDNSPRDNYYNMDTAEDIVRSWRNTYIDLVYGQFFGFGKDTLNDMKKWNPSDSIDAPQGDNE